MRIGFTFSTTTERFELELVFIARAMHVTATTR